MTQYNKFFKWLKDNNKLEIYSSMIDIYYNHGSIKQNRYTALQGIVELERQYSMSKLTIEQQIKIAKEEDELAKD